MQELVNEIIFEKLWRDTYSYSKIFKASKKVIKFLLLFIFSSLYSLYNNCVSLFHSIQYVLCCIISTFFCDITKCFFQTSLFYILGSNAIFKVENIKSLWDSNYDEVEVKKIFLLRFKLILVHFFYIWIVHFSILFEYFEK